MKEELRLELMCLDYLDAVEAGDRAALARLHYETRRDRAWAAELEQLQRDLLEEAARLAMEN